MKPTKILLGVLLLTLATGCACPKMPLMPPRPTLTVTENADGGICLSRDETRRLLEYLWQLEEGYE